MNLAKKIITSIVCVNLLISFSASADIKSREGRKYFEYGGKSYLLSKEDRLSESQAEDVLEFVKISYKTKKNIYSLVPIWDDLDAVYQGKLYGQIMFYLYKTHYNYVIDSLKSVGSPYYILKVHSGDKIDIYSLHDVLRGMGKSSWGSGRVPSFSKHEQREEYLQSVPSFKLSFSRAANKFHMLVPEKWPVVKNGEIDSLYTKLILVFKKEFTPELTIAIAEALYDYSYNKERFVEFCKKNDIKLNLKKVDLYL